MSTIMTDYFYAVGTSDGATNAEISASSRSEASNKCSHKDDLELEQTDVTLNPRYDHNDPVTNKTQQPLSTPADIVI